MDPMRWSKVVFVAGALALSLMGCSDRLSSPASNDAERLLLTERVLALQARVAETGRITLEQRRELDDITRDIAAWQARTGRSDLSVSSSRLASPIGTAALIALGDNDPRLESEYQKLGTTAGAYDDWHEGRDPAGITTQDPVLAARLDPVKAGHRLANYLAVLTMETQIIARACGKSHVHNLEPDDLVALTVESAAMAQVPLAGTNWIPGQGKY